MTKYITYILTFFFIFGLTSCQDDYFDRVFSHEGDDVLLSIDFMPVSSASLQTRAGSGSPGEGMKDIKDLCLVFFTEVGEFAAIKDISELHYQSQEIDRNEQHTSNGQITSEVKTLRRDYHLDLPTGKFYIYAVANMGANTYATLENLGVEDMTREEFRQIRRQWDTQDYSNNSEMSGICTIGALDGTAVKSGMEENPVSVQPGVNLHCWLRRLASKVTVDFDATHLDPSTTIYLKEIRVKDVPFDCSLVAPNKATEAKGVENGIITESGEFIRLCGDAYVGDDNSNFESWPYLTAAYPTLSAFVGSFDASTPAPIKAQKEKLESIGHLNSSPCLYFYENMQGVQPENPKLADIDDENGKPGAPDGVIDSPNSYDPNDADYKDRVPGGTYVEVEAYYKSLAVGNEGQGRIIYRFMLGKNEIDDYDAERNYHYKLTLCFMGYANDVDWHIEYDVDRPPYSIPDEYYISYGYNEMLEFPITVTGELVDGRITAEIVRNDWHPSIMWTDQHPATGPGGAGVYRPYVHESNVIYPPKDENKVSYGFLSLRKSQNDVIGSNKRKEDGSIEPYPAGESPAYIWKAWYGDQLDPEDHSRVDFTNNEIYTTNYDFNENQSRRDYYKRLYEGKRTLAYRVYQFEDLSSKGNEEIVYDAKENAESEDGSYRVNTKKPRSNKDSRESTYYIPLYTRERNICKSTGYTGENPYNNYQRRAAVIFRFTVKDRKGNLHNIEKKVPIIQVAKIGNPMGIWRDWNNAAPFDVQLKYVNEDGATYSDLTSHEGGWSAEVEQGADWILLNGGRKKVTGDKDSKIHFTYRPIGVLANKNQVRCGIITVRYHNFACIHKIFVRQGYAPLKIQPGGVYFHTGNLITADTEADNPCDEGSMFKSGNLDDPIDAINNVNDEGFVLGRVTPNMFKDHSATKFKIAEKNEYKTWAEIKTNGHISTSLNWPNKITLKDGSECEMMTIQNIADLRDKMDKNTERIRYQYGVMYSDKATTTANTTAEAFRYKQANPATHSYGMRGCFIYNNTDGRQLFFPIGSSGYGKRKAAGQDKYAAIPEELGWSLYPYVGTAVLRYALRITYNVSGNNYMPLFWDIFRSEGANYWCQEKAPDKRDGPDRVALDLNYKTFDFSTLGEEVFMGRTLNNGSEAFFIRLISRSPR